MDKLLQKILCATQKEVLGYVGCELRSLGYTTVTKKEFVYASGEVPVLLVAHADTVHDRPPTSDTLLFSKDGRFISALGGVGGDDRCGVYMILQIAKKHKCHVLITTDEETGANGARSFAKSGIIPEINFIVELDRRGSEDAVFYSCDNPEFTKHVTGFGFTEAIGSFSDISVIAPALGVAAVNISAGYYNEHTQYEHNDLTAVQRNITHVSTLVSAKSQKFEYIEAVHRWPRGYGVTGWHNDDDYDYYGCPDTAERNTRWVSLLDESDFIRRPNGEITDCIGGYLIGGRGRLYRYLRDLGVAVPVSGYEAYTAQGTPARMDYNSSFEVDIVTEDDAHDLLDEYGGYSDVIVWDDLNDEIPYVELLAYMEVVEHETGKVQEFDDEVPEWVLEKSPWLSSDAC